jgi:hypothetical protein
VGVGAGGDHDDGDVAQAPQAAAQLETVHAGQHDVDQHDVGGIAVESVERLLTAAGLLDRPTLVFERQLHGRADALVVLHRQNASSHLVMMPRSRHIAGAFAN